MSQEEKNVPVEQQRLEKEQIEDMGSVYRTRGAHAIHCLTVIGQVEGHVEAPQGQKTTKYEHVIPQLVAVQEDPAIEGLLVLLNTVGGDVEAGLALAELIASISKPSAAVVLGGGHSIGIPLAVSAQRSFIVPTATMTVHPVRHSGMILGVPQTMRWFEQMQERITGFVASHSIRVIAYERLSLISPSISSAVRRISVDSCSGENPFSSADGFVRSDKSNSSDAPVTLAPSKVRLSSMQVIESCIRCWPI